MPIQDWSDDIMLVKLGPEPELTEELTAAHDLLRRNARSRHVVMDFAQVLHLNSSNLSQVLRIRKVVIDRDAKLRLAAMPDRLWAVFLTTGLDKVFDFAPDVPTALASLQLGR